MKSWGFAFFERAALLKGIDHLGSAAFEKREIFSFQVVQGEAILAAYRYIDNDKFGIGAKRDPGLGRSWYLRMIASRRLGCLCRHQ